MNAVITITGMQGVTQPDADTVELVTDGIYCRTEEGYQIRYLESEITGLMGTATTVDINPNEIVVERKGCSTQKWFSEREKRAAFSMIPSSVPPHSELTRGKSMQYLTITAAS